MNARLWLAIIGGLIGLTGLILLAVRFEWLRGAVIWGTYSAVVVMIVLVINRWQHGTK